MTTEGSMQSTQGAGGRPELIASTDDPVALLDEVLIPADDGLPMKTITVTATVQVPTYVRTDDQGNFDIVYWDSKGSGWDVVQYTDVEVQYTDVEPENLTIKEVASA